MGPLITVIAGWDDAIRSACFERIAGGLAAVGDTEVTDQPDLDAILQAGPDTSPRLGAIETTDPLGTAAGVLCATDGSPRAQLDAIVIALDATCAATRLAVGGSLPPNRRAAQHLAIADAVVLYHVGRLTTRARRALTAALRRVVPRATLLAPDEFEMGLGGFDVATVPERLARVAPTHSARRGSGTICLEHEGCVDAQFFVAWLDLVATGHFGKVWRLEACSPVGTETVVCAQGLGRYLEHAECAIEPQAELAGRVVLVGEDVDVRCLEAALRGTLAG
jgi:G3E family GTPase